MLGPSGRHRPLVSIGMSASFNLAIGTSSALAAGINLAVGTSSAHVAGIDLVVGIDLTVGSPSALAAGTDQRTDLLRPYRSATTFRSAPTDPYSEQVFGSGSRYRPLGRITSHRPVRPTTVVQLTLRLTPYPSQLVAVATITLFRLSSDSPMRSDLHGRLCPSGTPSAHLAGTLIGPSGRHRSAHRSASTLLVGIGLSAGNSSLTRAVNNGHRPFRPASTFRSANHRLFQAISHDQSS
jgi:hypothetical protein